MSTDLFALISFVLVSTFTPGPSNISSASMGVLHGYRKTLPFLVGLSAGFFVVMALSSWISTTLLSAFPALEPLLRFVGALYILYLAFSILKATYGVTKQQGRPLSSVHGLMLQLLNPKLILYAFTLFTAFLPPATGDPRLLLVAVILLTLTAFCATSVWALFGTAINASLHARRVTMIVNLALSLFLLYTAVDLVGVV